MMSSESLTSSVESHAIQSCWKQIGIWGNAECGELKRYTHCRHCPVYADAAARLLDRPSASTYREAWAGHFSEKKAELVLSQLSVLTFRIGLEHFALPMKVLQEVCDNRVIRTIPHRRDGHLLGVINVRGELLICVSLARILKLQADVPDAQDGSRLKTDRLIILASGSERIAFPVHEVHGISRIAPGDLRDVPATVVHSGTRCVSTVIHRDGKSIGLIDESRLMPIIHRSLE